VNVVQQVVAVLDAQRLPDARANDARRKEAGHLIDLETGCDRTASPERNLS
jgi:hypothetical protein